MTKRWAQVCGMTLALWSFLERSSHAEPLPIQLNYETEDGCGSAEAVLEQVSVMLGPSALRQPRELLRLDARIRRAGAGSFELTLRAPSEASVTERKLEVSSCADAVHATALLLAFMVDPNAPLAAPGGQADATATPPKDARPRETTPAAPPATASNPSATPNQPTKETATPVPLATKHVAAPSRYRYFIGISGGLDSGNLPRTALGLSLSLGLELPRLRFELRGSDWLTVEHASHQASDSGGRFKLYDAAALGCYRPFHAGREGLYVCGGTSGLFLRGSGYGMDQVSTKDSLYVSVLGEVAWVTRLSSRFAVRLAGSGLIALVRPEFAIQNEGTMHEPARLSGRVALGFECGF